MTEKKKLCDWFLHFTVVSPCTYILGCTDLRRARRHSSHFHVNPESSNLRRLLKLGLGLVVAGWDLENGSVLLENFASGFPVPQVVKFH